MGIDGYGGGENRVSRTGNSQSAPARFTFLHPAFPPQVRLAKNRSGIESFVVAPDAAIHF